MKNKIISLEESVKHISDGMLIGLGGNVLHRSPMSFVREVVRQNKRHLKIVKTAGGHDVDVLSAFGNIDTVDAGFVGNETKYGLASYYRLAVQEGKIKTNEHACYTVISALRAAKSGVGFMPVKGMMYGDLIDKNDYFKVIYDPFTNKSTTVVKAIEPDVSIIHVHEVDEEGNAFINGPLYDDVLLSKSSKKVIITSEKLISKSVSSRKFNEVKIPGFLVDHVIIVKGGARPGSCHNLYEVDEKPLLDFSENFENDYLEYYEKNDRGFRKVTYNALY